MVFLTTVPVADVATHRPSDPACVFPPFFTNSFSRATSTAAASPSGAACKSHRRKALTHPGTIVWTSDWGIRHHLSVWPNLEKYGTTLNEYRIPLVAHQQPHFENSATPRFRGRSLGPETQINLKRQSGVGRAVRRTRRFKVRRIYGPYSNIPAHRNWQIETADWIWPASSSVV